MYLISIYFDEKSNRILQGYMNHIAEKTKNAFMIKNKVPPHMTISSIEARNVQMLEPVFESLQEKLSGGEIQFVSIGQLLPYVFYVTPVLNQYLQSLSLEIFNAYSDLPETSISKFYQPLNWLPHVTLGKTLEKGQMQKAFEVMQERFTPFTARVTSIGLARVNPHEDVLRFDLK